MMATEAILPARVAPAYLNHPAHTKSERFGIPLMARFEAYDITDDDDPELLAALPSGTGTSVVPHAG
jgi:hypothetical protein